VEQLSGYPAVLIRVMLLWPYTGAGPPALTYPLSTVAGFFKLHARKRQATYWLNFLFRTYKWKHFVEPEEH